MKTLNLKFNQMKTITTAVMCAALLCLFLIGCKKYDEGPGLSFRSKSERVANVWKISYAYDIKDTLIVTGDYTGETWEFNKSGGFTERSNGIIDKTGTWNFISNKEKITVNLPGDTTTFTILMLKEKEMWLKDSQEELHLISAQ